MPRFIVELYSSVYYCIEDQKEMIDTADLLFPSIKQANIVAQALNDLDEEKPKGTPRVFIDR